MLAARVKAIQDAAAEQEAVISRLETTRKCLSTLLESQSAGKDSLQGCETSMDELRTEAATQSRGVEEHQQVVEEVKLQQASLTKSLKGVTSQLSERLDAEEAALRELQALADKIEDTVGKQEVEEFAAEIESVQGEIDGVLSDVEALQTEAESVVEGIDSLSASHRQEMQEQETKFEAIRMDAEAWRQRVESDVQPLEVADRKFRPLLQEKSRQMALEEEKRKAQAQKRREDQKKRNIAAAAKAPGAASTHKSEASAIAQSIKAKMQR